VDSGGLDGPDSLDVRGLRRPRGVDPGEHELPPALFPFRVVEENVLVFARRFKPDVIRRKSYFLVAVMAVHGRSFLRFEKCAEARGRFVLRDRVESFEG
jgi:hypothetical protein